MDKTPVVVAVNGSPHMGAGNTGMMLAMIGAELQRLGLGLEIIHLTDHRIEYCVGCGHCLERGRCWIPDDHAAIVERLLAADAVVLASPVYFFHVTAQTKTFLDRSLALGHKPRPTWKPGLAVSVSAGSGETAVAAYLEGLLRVYGAFPVGSLTALATVPGGSWARRRSRRVPRTWRATWRGRSGSGAATRRPRPTCGTTPSCPRWCATTMTRS